RDVLQRDARPELLRHDDEHLADFVLVGRIEERNVDLGATLTLEVDRQQVGPRREQHPDDTAAVARVANLRGDIRDNPARRTRVAYRLAAAERRIRLVHDDDDWSHRPED